MNVHIEMPPHPDPVEHPAHYTDGRIEVWDFIADKQLDYFRGCVVKYVCRSGKKDPAKTIEDLEKARAYLKKAISQPQEEDRPLTGQINPWTFISDKHMSFFLGTVVDNVVRPGSSGLVKALEGLSYEIERLRDAASGY